MAQITWTEPALDDLNDIAEYISLDDFEAAQKLIHRVFSKVERLEDFPLSGKKPIELGKTNYREIIVGPCRIFYRVDKEIVFILYVVRGERKLRQFIIEERVKNQS